MAQLKYCGIYWENKHFRFEDITSEDMILQVLTTASPIRANMAVSALTMVMPTRVRALPGTQALTVKQVRSTVINHYIIYIIIINCNEFC